jgi:hypothetical protein
VARFVEDVASILPKYGLDKPQLQLTLSSFASENTAETQAGEQAFVTIAFGKVDGDRIYARLADEPFVVAVRRALLDQISTDPLQWQELSIFKLKPEQIHRLSVTAKYEVTLARDAKGEWNWVAGAGQINQTNLRSLLSTLSNLRAVRWVGPTIPQQGFDKPQLAISFTTSPNDKSPHRLLVGSAAGDGTWFAHVDEREGTFVINASDLNVFRLPLAIAPGSPPASAAGANASPIPSASAGASAVATPR